MMAAQMVKGFTLLEILVVMTLATLLLTVVPANFSAMVPGVQQQAQVRSFVSALRATRGMAVRERREVVLMLDLKRRQYHLEGEKQLKQLPDNLRIGFQPALPSDRSDSVVEIRFFADGSSSGGVIEMVADEASYRVTIDWLTGKVGYVEAV